MSLQCLLETTVMIWLVQLSCRADLKIRDIVKSEFNQANHCEPQLTFKVFLYKKPFVRDLPHPVSTFAYNKLEPPLV